MARRPKDQRPSFDICRIKTDRLRVLPRKSLDRVWRHLGKRRSSRGKELVSRFVTALVWATNRPNWGTKRQRSFKATMANRLERQIWDLQQQRGCKISPDEAIARDAIRQGGVDQATIDRLRGRRRPRIR